MKKFDNIEPMPNPKPIRVQRVWVALINRRESESEGFDVYDRPTFDGFLREKSR